MPASTALRASRVPQPGDPDFNWSEYDSWKANNDPVASAQAYLAKPDLIDPSRTNAQTATQYLGQHPEISGSGGPRVGEIRRGTSESVRWDGTRWEPIAHQSAPSSPLDSLSDFLGGAISTSPLNPMNLARAVAHPLNTIGHAIGDPISEVAQAATHAKNAIVNPGDEGFVGRGAEAMQAIEHLGGAVPLVGRSAIHAGENIGSGNVARGTGELTGLASGAFLPSLVQKMPRTISATGRGVERVGTALGETKIGGYGVPGLALAEAVMRSDPKGLAIAAAPTVLKYTGRGMQRVGSALDGLPDSIRALTGDADEPISHADLVARGARAYRAGKVQQAAAANASGLTSLRDEMPYPWVRSTDTLVPDDFIGSMGPDVVRGSAQSANASPAFTLPSSLRALERNDDLWGPGSTTKTGELSQADATGRLIYDPQTPTEYIRQQLRDATDPTQREFLAKALRQRYNISRRPRLAH